MTSSCAGLGRARKLLDGVVELEEEGAGQHPHVLEALLGEGALAAGHARLPGGGHETAHEAQAHGQGRGHEAAVAPHELGRTIAGACRAER